MMVLASMTKLLFQSQAVTLHISVYVMNCVELVIHQVLPISLQSENVILKRGNYL